MQMPKKSIVMVGGPNSGKSNFLARLWAALADDEGELEALTEPPEMAYIEYLVSHLNRGEFVGRSNPSMENVPQHLELEVAIRGTKVQGATLAVPDIRGEIWKAAVKTAELPQRWYDLLSESGLALLFVRAHSDDNHQPPDWVATQAQLMAGLDDPAKAGETPTQVLLCELLRMLESTLPRQGARPRVAVVVSAWDLLDPEFRARAPLDFLGDQFPLFAGRLHDTLSVDVAIFGLSILGADVQDEDFKQRVLTSGLKGLGYVTVADGDVVRNIPDPTYPIQWLIGHTAR